MKRLFSLSMLFMLTAPAGASAQTAASPPRASDYPLPEEIRAKFQPMVEERLAFFRKYYALSEGDAAKLRAEFERLITDQAVYSGRWNVTLRRRTIALSRTLPNELEISESLRQELMQRYQDEIYDIHLKSPLGYANLARRVEAGMSPEAVEAAHKRIAADYAARLSGKPLKIDELDRVVIPPVKPDTSPNPLEYARKPDKQAPSATLSKHDKTSTTPANTSREAAPGPRPAGPPPPPRADEPAKQLPVEPAPPLDSWQTKLDEWMDYYRFDEKQRDSAAAVLESCTQRAKAHRDANAESYQKANAESDEAARQKAVAALDAKLDGLYNEMRRRVDSIATLQQKAEAAARDKMKDESAESGS